MPTATYTRSSNISFRDGNYTYSFNPTGDVSGAKAGQVRYAFTLDYNGGRAVDLGKVTVYLISPDGERQSIYLNLNNPLRIDTDDGEDADDANDYDIQFDGRHPSALENGFRGDPVNGLWKIGVDNDSGKTLTMRNLKVWVDYTSPDLTVSDLRFNGNPALGELMTITADITNIGDAAYRPTLSDPVVLNYYVNDQFVGSRSTALDFSPGETNTQNLFGYRVTQAGVNTVRAEIAGTSGEPTGNNSRTESFTPKAADIIVTDIRLDGPVRLGQEVTIEADFKNIGDDAHGTRFDVEYYVNGTFVGDDYFTFGFLAGATGSRSTKYTVSEPGSQEVEVRITKTEDEITTNNTRTEFFSLDPSTGANLAERGEEIELAGFFNRAVYGKEKIPASYRGDKSNGSADDYAGYVSDQTDSAWSVLTADDLAGAFLGVSSDGSGIGVITEKGLYIGGATGGPLNESQALLAEGELADGTKALILSFRGTDNLAQTLSSGGQAYTGDGLYDHYMGHRPLIEAAIRYANADENGIKAMVVTGHSLGGSMVDIFSAVDAGSLDSSVKLTAIAVAPAGVDPNVYTDSRAFKGFDGRYDTNVVEETLFSVKLTAPDFYIGLAHSADRVTFADTDDEDGGMIPNFTLTTNVNFDDAIFALDLPGIVNNDLNNGKLIYPNAFGAEHDPGLYWATLSGLGTDPLLPYFDEQAIRIGRDSYVNQPDYDGMAFGVFGDYVRLNVAGDANDRNLRGSQAEDYLLGVAGNDALNGLDGNDLLSGGAGLDTLYGGNGDDRMDGGRGNDLLGGGQGDDTMHGGGGNDRLFGAFGNDSMEGGEGNDLLGGFDGNDNLRGGGGNDELWGSRGHDTLSGDAGDDLMGGFDGNDSLLGGSGHDEIWGGRGDDQLSGDAGDDRIGAGHGNDSVSGGQGADLIFGGLGHDLLWGNADNDTLYGGDGDDIIDGGLGNDAMFAGWGLDTIMFSAGQDTVSFFAAEFDKLDLSQAQGIDGVADLFANHLGFVGRDAVVTDEAGNSLTMIGANTTALDADTFLF